MKKCTLIWITELITNVFQLDGQRTALKHIIQRRQFSVDKKCQAWSLDLVIAITIFVIGLIGIYIYALNLSYNPEERLNLIRSEAELISSVILSEGYPENWTISNVESPGVISEDKINHTKLEELYLFSSSPENYQSLRKKLHTKYDFYIQFNRNVSLSSGKLSGFGKPGISFDQNSSNYISNVENVTDIIKATRFSIYENKPIRVDFYVW